ncbi:uncharacterized protein LOC105286036 [Ooceraea biroi]|uniref:uncharacterized protein LOC105286036 n=1 Tax=Ooceraea biroi TaxID=2015173 RepID=UPI0005BB610A|nr:uncharacterized protein LOC105286036 [Ooceraea biroi]
MMNEYDMKGIHKYMDHSVIPTDPNTTMHLAKINVITPIISEPIRNIMDFTLLVTGVSLNTLLGLVIILNPYMHTSTNCYVMSLVFSNVLILVEPLKQVLDWSFDINLNMNFDYMFLVSFSTSILTIILLKIEAYIVVCHKNSRLHKQLLNISTAVKCILYVWTICVMVTVMELHLYIHFEEEVMHHIYETSTIMFLVFPCFIFVMLDSFILYDLIILKLIDGTWPSKDTKHFIFLIGITIGYVSTMIPYRVTRAIALVTESCCSDMAIEVVYTMLKIYPLILPITCFVISNEFCQAIKKMLVYRREMKFSP